MNIWEPLSRAVVRSSSELSPTITPLCVDQPPDRYQVVRSEPPDRVRSPWNRLPVSNISEAWSNTSTPTRQFGAHASRGPQEVTPPGVCAYSVCRLGRLFTSSTL